MDAMEQRQLVVLLLQEGQEVPQVEGERPLLQEGQEVPQVEGERPLLQVQQELRWEREREDD